MNTRLFGYPLIAAMACALLLFTPRADADVVQVLGPAGDGTHAVDEVAGTAVDLHGNIFVASSRAPNIFRITPAGEVVSWLPESKHNSVGPPGWPVTDGFGNVYFLSRPNVDGIPFRRTVYLLGRDQRLVSELSGDVAVAADSLGNLYAADGASTRVTRFTPDEHLNYEERATTVIESDGDGSTAMTTPTAVALDGDGNVYASDDSSHLFRVTLAGAKTLLATLAIDGGEAPVAAALAVAVDGTVYATSNRSDGSYVLAIAADGQQTVLLGPAGDGVNPFAGATAKSIVVDSAGSVFVAGSISNTVFRIAADGAVQLLATAAGDGVNALLGAGSLSLALNGDLVVGGSTSNNVFRIGGVAAPRPNTAPLAVVLENAPPMLPANVDVSSRFKVADIFLADDLLGANDLSLSGADAAFFEIDGSELFLAAGVALDFESMPALTVTVEVDDSSLGGSPDASSVYTVRILAAIEPVIGPQDEGADSFYYLEGGIDADAAGNIVVANTRWYGGGSSILTITPEGAVTTALSEDSGLISLGLTQFGADGTIYFRGYIPQIGPGELYTIAGDAPPTVLISDDALGSDNLLELPTALVLDAQDTLYVAYAYPPTVLRRTPDGTITTMIDSSGDGTDPLYYPANLALDAEGNLYVASDASEYASFRVTPAGGITPLPAYDDVYPIEDQYALAVDSAGNVYVGGAKYNASDYGRLVKIAPDGSVTEVLGREGDGTTAFGAIDNSRGIAIDGADNVFVLGRGNHTVWRVSPDGAVRLLAAQHEGDRVWTQLNGLALAPNGDLLVAAGGMPPDNPGTVFRLIGVAAAASTSTAPMSVAWYPALALPALGDLGDADWRHVQLFAGDDLTTPVVAVKVKGSVANSQAFFDTGFGGLLPDDYVFRQRRWEPMTNVFGDYQPADLATAPGEYQLRVDYDYAGAISSPGVTVDEGDLTITFTVAAASAYDVRVVSDDGLFARTLEQLIPPAADGTVTGDAPVSVSLRVPVAGLYHVYGRGYNPRDLAEALPAFQVVMENVLVETGPAPEPPGSAENLVPRDGQRISATTATTSVAMRWDAAVGASGYLLQVSGSKGVILNMENVGNVTSVTLDLPEDNYYWSVMPYFDPDGDSTARLYGDWSAAINFRLAQTLAQPVTTGVQILDDRTLVLDPDPDSAPPASVVIYHMAPGTRRWRRWRSPGTITLDPATGAVTFPAGTLGTGTHTFFVSGTSATGVSGSYSRFSVMVP